MQSSYFDLISPTLTPNPNCCSRFCDNPKAANDGSEFTLKSGQFVNAKAKRDLGEFVTVEDDHQNLNTTETLREYEDEQGGRVLALTLDGASMVGQTISDGNRTLTIVKEVPRL